MGRSEDEFFNSSLGKTIKLINIHEGTQEKPEKSIDDLPVATSMKELK